MSDDTSVITCLRLITRKDTDALDTVLHGGIRARTLIELLKNNLEDLEYFLSWLQDNECYVGAGSYHYTDIRDNQTFDLYHKYGLKAMNFRRDCVNAAQWDYVRQIGYITQQEYNDGNVYLSL